MEKEIKKFMNSKDNEKLSSTMTEEYEKTLSDKVDLYPDPLYNIDLLKSDKDLGLRFNEGKERYDLLEPFSIKELVKVFTAGSKKYSDNNWLKGMKWSKMRASLGRHLGAYDNCEDFDFDPTCKECIEGTCKNHTNLYHIAQVAWNALCILSYYKHFPQGDDRYRKPDRRIGLDIDEVICDFTEGWAREHGVDERPTCWNYHRNMGKEFKKMKEEDKLDNFYLSLRPKIRPEEIPFEPCCYVTSRPVSTEITERWLEMHKFPGSKVITVGIDNSKIEALKNEGVEVFVDDAYHNFLEMNNAGILCYLLDAPHNRRYNVGYKRIKSLKELI